MIDMRRVHTLHYLNLYFLGSKGGCYILVEERQMITDLLMTGAGLPFTKRNGMMVVKKFADCPQEMDFNSNADNLYHDHKMLRRIAQPSTEHTTLHWCLLEMAVTETFLILLLSS